MRDVSDPELVEASEGGDKQAFEELVRRYQDPVFGLAYRMTGNHADAADLAQEAFVRAYRKLAMYKPQYSFRNWVMSICANLAKNRFRRRARRRQAEEEHLQRKSEGRRSEDPRLARLDEALYRVPQKLRLPLVLKHVEGLSYQDIAGIAGIGMSAAKMRVKRGRDELAQLLQATEGRRQE